MLILTRRIGEVLIIGDDVKVTVLGVRGHQVRIGVDAPKSVPVHRKEVYDQVQQQNEVQHTPRSTTECDHIEGKGNTSSNSQASSQE